MEMRELGPASPPRSLAQWRLEHTTRLADYRGRLSSCLLELLDASTAAERRHTLSNDAAVLQALIKNVEDELASPPLLPADVPLEPHVEVSSSICLNRMRQYIMPLTLFKIANCAVFGWLHWHRVLSRLAADAHIADASRDFFLAQAGREHSRARHLLVRRKLWRACQYHAYHCRVQHCV